MNLFKLLGLILAEVESRPLSANVYGAEAQNYVAACGRTPKAKHRTKAREHQQLVELVPHIRAVRPGQNLVASHSAFGINSHVDQQTMWQGQFHIMFGRP